MYSISHRKHKQHKKVPGRILFSLSAPWRPGGRISISLTEHTEVTEGRAAGLQGTSGTSGRAGTPGTGDEVLFPFVAFVPFVSSW